MPPSSLVINLHKVLFDQRIICHFAIIYVESISNSVYTSTRVYIHSHAYIETCEYLRLCLRGDFVIFVCPTTICINIDWRRYCVFDVGVGRCGDMKINDMDMANC